MCVPSDFSVSRHPRGAEISMGHLAEKGHGNTGAGFVERNVPWKVFFGRMSNNKVGEEVWEQE